MKKYLLIFLMVLLVPIVASEEHGVSADIKNITINTWIDSNKSFCEIGFETKDVYDNEEFYKKINSDENYTKDRWEIRFTKDIDCNITTEGMLLDYFTECGDSTCKESYDSCLGEINLYKNLSESHINNTNAYINCVDDKISLNNQKDNYRNKYNNCTGNLVDETEKRESAEGWKFGWLIIGLIIATIFHNRSKLWGTKEDKEMGVTTKMGDGTKILNKIQEKVFGKKKKPIEIEEDKKVRID